MVYGTAGSQLLPCAPAAGAAPAPRSAHCWNSSVLMLKPKVGLMEEMSSPLIRFMIVVFPALSRPLQQLATTDQQGPQ